MGKSPPGKKAAAPPAATRESSSARTSASTPSKRSPPEARRAGISEVGAYSTLVGRCNLVGPPSGANVHASTHSAHQIARGIVVTILL